MANAIWPTPGEFFVEANTIWPMLYGQDYMANTIWPTAGEFFVEANTMANTA